VISESDVGFRVVVRRIVGIRRERPLFSDALGELLSVTDTEVILETEHGTLVVPVHDIARAKRVPPGPRGVVALERAAAEGWPAPDTQRLGGWLLRTAGGWTNRANSALALGDPGLPLAAAIEATIAFYSDHNLTPRITTPLPVSLAIARDLAARGWVAQPTALVQTALLERIPRVPGPEVRLETAPSAEWLALVGGWKGPIPAAARSILTAPGEVRFAEVYEGATLVATARGAVTGEWLGISLVGVAPEARRQGLARRMTSALAEWGASVGARRAYLQVDAENQPALALYAAMGFTTHHTYITWRLDPA
jgi:GNAT superfamily N-acetyltransferase